MHIAISHTLAFPLTLAFIPFVRSATVSYGIWPVQGIRKFYGIHNNKRIQKHLQLLPSKRKNPQPTTHQPTDKPKFKMPALKRKQVSSTSIPQSSGNKRPKKGISRSAKALRGKQARETETDSDPMVESDTTENSGDDNGVSWPSDHASEAQDSSAGEGAGVAVSQNASKRGSYVLPRKVRLAKRDGIGMILP